jgi:hypothetical protein
MILSIDPGTKTGAAALLDGDKLVAWWVWSRMTRGYRTTYSHGQRVDETIFDVGTTIGSLVLERRVDVLAIEGLFGGDQPAGGVAAGSNPLVESVGELRAGLRFVRLRWDREARPMAVQRSKKGAPGWRRVALGLPDKLNAAAAEAVAIERAADRGVLPRDLTRAEQGALAESYWIGIAVSKSSATE